MGREAEGGPRFGNNTRVDGDVFTGGKHEYHNETIYNTVLRGPDELPTRYDGRVQSFLEYYLGTAQRPVPFGGRAANLAALDRWLAEAGAPPYALLAAPAGRGKSGLLAHWVARLSERGGGPHLVYFPISIRFQTNTESVVFASLAARLAHLHGEKVSPLVDAQQYRGLFADYLRRPPPNGGRVLVVMDGLDEAGGWEAGADLFPIAPPPHLRVVAAARLMAGDLDGSAWLAQLGWEQPGLARRMALEALDRAGVADVLDQLAAVLGEPAKNQALVDRLYTLSEGDPLLVRLYVGALLPQGGQAAAFKPSDLDNMAPGLKAFLKQWMKEQMSLWGPADPTESETVQGVLDACAMALGPLRRDDLLALDKALFSSGRAIIRALRPLSRLIIGDAESGYVFSHPRLDEYFVDEMAPDERAAWDSKFLDYGARSLKALADGSLAPAAASPYLLQHYGAHLEQTHAPSAEIYALLAKGWLRGHESVLGTPAGFLDDARRVARRARADGPAALGQQVRAALSFASIAAIGSNIAPDLLEACARAGVISGAAALVLARQKASLRDRVRCLAALGPLLPAAQQTAVLDEAFQAAELIGGWDRAEALLTIAKALPKPAPARLADRLLEAARTWEGILMRAAPLAQIASALPDSEAKPILAEALTIARAEPEASNRATQLLAVAKALPEVERLVIAREAWQAARLVDGDAYRAELLGQAAEHLPEAERAAAM
ncbi:MAG: ATP-binding protein, partial [Anaerolineales bacterium]